MAAALKIGRTQPSRKTSCRAPTDSALAPAVPAQDAAPNGTVDDAWKLNDAAKAAQELAQAAEMEPAKHRSLDTPV